MPRTTTNDRAKRRKLLLDLLEAGVEATQDELVGRLADKGIKATQATISRDLDDLGAVRRHENGHIVYGLPESNGPPAGFGRRVFAELVKDLATSSNIIVVRTFPGMAPTVAAVIDQSEVAGVLGTVAGDDTVLVVADEETGGKTVAKRIAGLGGGR